MSDRLLQFLFFIRDAASSHYDKVVRLDDHVIQQAINTLSGLMAELETSRKELSYHKSVEEKVRNYYGYRWQPFRVQHRLNANDEWAEKYSVSSFASALDAALDMKGEYWRIVFDEKVVMSHDPTAS